MLICIGRRRGRGLLRDLKVVRDGKRCGGWRDAELGVRLRKALLLTFFGPCAGLVVATTLLLTTCAADLERAFEWAEAVGTDDALEVGLDEDDVGTFREVREVLAALPKVVVDGALCVRFDFDGDRVREGSVAVEVS